MTQMKQCAQPGRTCPVRLGKAQFCLLFFIQGPWKREFVVLGLGAITVLITPSSIFLCLDQMDVLLSPARSGPGCCREMAEGDQVCTGSWEGGGCIGWERCSLGEYVLPTFEGVDPH